MIINIEKQIAYWISSAESDLDSAEILIANRKYLQGLFFCHLAIQKALKAHIVKITKSIPPKSCNLILLLEKTSLIIEESDGIFLGILMKYQLQGRYPDYNPFIPDEKIVIEYLTKIKELFRWFKAQL